MAKRSRAQARAAAAERLGTDFVEPTTPMPAPSTPLELLEQLHQERQTIDQLIFEQAIQARLAGSSLAAIGAAIGMTSQGVGKMLNPHLKPGFTPS